MRSYRIAERALPLAIVIGAFACTPMLNTSPTLDVRPVETPPNPNVPVDEGYYQSAVNAIAKRDYALALSYLQAARTNEPDSARVLNAFGVVYDKLGRFDLSARYYAQAEVADPQSKIVARNEQYSKILQGLLKGDITPAQLAAAGPAPTPPVVVEAETRIVPAVAPNRVAAATEAQPAKITATNVSAGADTGIVQPASGSQAGISMPPVTVNQFDRTISEAKIEAPSIQVAGLANVKADLTVAELPQVEPFTLDAADLQRAALSAKFDFTSQPGLQESAPSRAKPRAEQDIESRASLAATPPATTLTALQLLVLNDIAPQIVPQSSVLEGADTKPDSRAPSRATPKPIAIPANFTVKAEVPASARPIKIQVPPALAQTSPDRPHTILKRDLPRRASVSVPPAKHVAAAAKPVAIAQARAPARVAPKKNITPIHQQFAALHPNAVASRLVAVPAGDIKRTNPPAPGPKPGLLIRHALVIVNASAQKNADDPIRRALLRRNWSIARKRIVAPHRETGTTLIYADSDLAVAKALVRTLALPIRLVPDVCHCEGLKLVIGTNALHRRYSELENNALRRSGYIVGDLNNLSSGARRW